MNELLTVMVLNLPPGLSPFDTFTITDDSGTTKGAFRERAEGIRGKISELKSQAVTGFWIQSLVVKGLSLRHCLAIAAIVFPKEQGYSEIIVSSGAFRHICKPFEHGKSAMSACDHECFSRLIKSEPVALSSRHVHQASCFKDLLIVANSKNDLTMKDKICFIPRM